MTAEPFGGEVYAWPLIGVEFPSPRLSGSVEWNGGMELQIGRLDPEVF